MYIYTKYHISCVSGYPNPTFPIGSEVFKYVAPAKGEVVLCAIDDT